MMKTMKRTQIYLPAGLHRELTIEARKRQVTLSELIRCRIKTAPPRQTYSQGNNIFDELDAISQKLDWGKASKNLSGQIDNILYGKSK